MIEVSEILWPGVSILVILVWTAWGGGINSGRRKFEEERFREVWMPRWLEAEKQGEENRKSQITKDKGVKMGTQKFIASAKYGDWKGGAAADSADKNGAEEWLKINGHKNEDEFLLGFTMCTGENHGAYKDPVYIDFLLATPGEHNSVKAMIDSAYGPVEVRKVSVQMELVEFFGLFKRFDIALSSHGMLGECEYTYPE